MTGRIGLRSKVKASKENSHKRCRQICLKLAIVNWSYLRIICLDRRKENWGKVSIIHVSWKIYFIELILIIITVLK